MRNTRAFKVIVALATLTLTLSARALAQPSEASTEQARTHGKSSQGASDVHSEKQSAATPACCRNDSATTGNGSGEPSVNKQTQRTLRDQHDEFLREVWKNP